MSGGRGGVSSKRVLGGTWSGRPAPTPRRPTPWDLGEGGPAPTPGVRLPPSSWARAGSPGRGDGAGRPEWHSERGGWDVGPTDAPRRQPPGGQLIYPSIPLAPGGLEPPRCRGPGGRG